MNGDFVVLMDKKNKPKKCVVNEKNKVLYVKKNNTDVKYVKHNNKFILKNEYAKLCKKKTKKMRGGATHHIAYIDNDMRIIKIVSIDMDDENVTQEVNGKDDKEQLKYIPIKYDNNFLYFKTDEGIPAINNEFIKEVTGNDKYKIWNDAIINNLIKKSIDLGVYNKDIEDTFKRSNRIVVSHDVEEGSIVDEDAIHGKEIKEHDVELRDALHTVSSSTSSLPSISAVSSSTSSLPSQYREAWAEGGRLLGDR